jgi:hypothetical protein
VHNRWIQDNGNPAGRERRDFFVNPPGCRSFVFRPTRQVAPENPGSTIGSMSDGSCRSLGPWHHAERQRLHANRADGLMREDLFEPDDEMVRFFCPRRWEDFTEDTSACPSCGLRIHEVWGPLDHLEKLIVALSHPEPSTPVRGAHLLGRIGDQRAVPALIRTVETTRDVYLARASIRALGEIGSPEAIRFLRSLTAHPARLIGEKPERALSSREEVESAGQADKD